MVLTVQILVRVLQRAFYRLVTQKVRRASSLAALEERLGKHVPGPRKALEDPHVEMEWAKTAPIGSAHIWLCKSSPLIALLKV